MLWTRRLCHCDLHSSAFAIPRVSSTSVLARFAGMRRSVLDVHDRFAKLKARPADAVMDHNVIHYRARGSIWSVRASRALRVAPRWAAPTLDPLRPRVVTYSST